MIYHWIWSAVIGYRCFVHVYWNMSFYLFCRRAKMKADRYCKWKQEILRFNYNIIFFYSIIFTGKRFLVFKRACCFDTVSIISILLDICFICFIKKIHKCKENICFYWISPYQILLFLCASTFMSSNNFYKASNTREKGR